MEGLETWSQTLALVYLKGKKRRKGMSICLVNSQESIAAAFRLIGSPRACCGKGCVSGINTGPCREDNWAEAILRAYLEDQQGLLKDSCSVRYCERDPQENSGRNWKHPARRLKCRSYGNFQIQSTKASHKRISFDPHVRHREYGTISRKKKHFILSYHSCLLWPWRVLRKQLLSEGGGRHVKEKRRWQPTILIVSKKATIGLGFGKKSQFKWLFKH